MAAADDGLFDLAAYADEYRGATRLRRLLFAAEAQGAPPPTRARAFRLALEHIKKHTLNTELYKSTLAKFSSVRAQLPVDADGGIGGGGGGGGESKEQRGGGGGAGDVFAYDERWVEATDARAGKTLDRLTMDLNAAKTNCIKESVRMGHNDLGDHFYDRGDYVGALKWYMRNRDYNTTPNHQVQMCLKIIRVSVELENYTHVQNYASKAEGQVVGAAGMGADGAASIGMGADAAVVSAKLHTCAGLAALHQRHYGVAAAKPVEILQNTVSDRNALPLHSYGPDPHSC